MLASRERAASLPGSAAVYAATRADDAALPRAAPALGERRGGGGEVVAFVQQPGEDQLATAARCKRLARS